MSSLTDADYSALGDFRYQIRRFLHFSEEAALAAGLEPQQHQLMLGIRALDGPEGPTVGRLAEFLMIRHHSAVGLIDRLAHGGLVERIPSNGDRRQVRVALTPAGAEKLEGLAAAHHAELSQSGPALVETLGTLLRRNL